MTIVTTLAERICALRYDRLPDAAVDWAKVGILDTVGVTLAGSVEPCAQIVGRVAAAPGPALVFGTAGRLAVADAALVNGTASHALDFDDCSNTLGGHPSAPVLPALFALADARAVSGRDFIAAYVAGFETETRIARAVNFHHYDKGWHPTATLGVFGAAAAASHLMGLTTAQTATALAIAASFSSGLKANFGTMTKPLHVGHCSRNGAMAALLAREGFTANADVFEHRQGFFEVFNGAGNYDAEAVLRDWAEPFDIVTPGIAIKRYPCCGSTHPAIDALLDLVDTHALTADNVTRIVSWTHPRRLAHTNRPTVRSALDAKFSVQYCLARALVDRQVVLSHFDDGAYLDPRVAEVMARVEAAPHPDMSIASTAPHFGAEVTVTTIDGRRLTKAVDIALGRTSANPLPRTVLEAKYRDCAARVLDADAVARSLDLLANFEKLDRVSALSDVLAAGCTSERAAAPALARAV
jgi:2-methylcitrate dehydratase PrpD